MSLEAAEQYLIELLNQSRLDPVTAADLPPEAPSFITRVCGFVLCYPNCPRLGLDFPHFDHTDGLDASGNFISAAGTLFPIALCGRSSL